VKEKRGVLFYVMFATKNLKARCDVARHPLWRYIKGRHRSCYDTCSFATDLKNYYNFFKLVAKLHVSSQLRWRPLTYRHRGCRATSSTVARWYILCWTPSLFVCLFLRGCTTWTGGIKCRKGKTGFCQQRQCKPVLLRLSLAGNLEK